MKKFLLKLIIFTLALLLVITIGFFLPQTPRASKSLLNSQVQKDSLLINVESPRLILIGGSNLSLGINSQIFKDSLNLNPINTAIHGNIGLVYMLDHTLPYIKNNDIVIVVPEYDHFFGDYAYGNEELLRTVASYDKSELLNLRWKQQVNISNYILKYSFSKFKPLEYIRAKEDPIYGVNSYNKYGDAINHWNLAKKNYPVSTAYTEAFNMDIINELKVFESKVKDKNAKIFISFPAYQDKSYANRKAQISKINSLYIENNFNILGSAERYYIADSLTFDSPYHLTKIGVDLRTKLLIEDIKNARLN